MVHVRTFLVCPINPECLKSECAEIRTGLRSDFRDSLFFKTSTRVQNRKEQNPNLPPNPDAALSRCRTNFHAT